MSDPTNLNDKWLNAATKIYFREQNYESIEPEAVAMLLPSAEEESSVWKYTTEDPGTDWVDSKFSDVDWKSGASVFGSPDAGNHIKTPWTSEEIWLRKTFTLDKLIAEPVLKVLFDEDYEIFINGELFFQETGYNRNYKFIRLDTELGQLFKQGTNSIAVHCRNENGRQFIDVGIGAVRNIPADQSITLQTVPTKNGL